MIGAHHHLSDHALTPERVWLAPFLSPSLPPGWTRSDMHETSNGAGWRSKSGLGVILSGAVELDDRRWVHVSVSRRDRVPSYEDLALVKRIFVGRERRAVQLFVPESEHVNLHRYCLHLWHCVDGDGLPDFRAGGQV